MLNTILAKRVNHIVAKRANPDWPKGSKLRGFSRRTEFMKDNMNSIIEAAFWAGFEPSSDDLTEAALYEEAKAYLEKSIQY